MYPTPEPTPQPLPDPKAAVRAITNMTTTFEQFPLLPPEIRNMIWDLALPGPVVYDIYPASSTQMTPAEQGLRFVHPSSEPPPALAAVCRESRSLALHRYRPLTLDGTTKYVNLRQDILLLESSLYRMDLFRALYFMGQIPVIRENLRSLAFGTSYGVHTGLCHPILGWQKLTRNNMGRFLQRLTALKRLEKLVFVIHQEAQFAMSELPPAPEDEYARDGQVLLNATLYSEGSTPPRPRVLAGRDIAAVIEDGQARLTAETSSSSFSSSSQPLCSVESDPATADDSHFRRVPWTGQKPGVPHVNELYYYPVDAPEETRKRTRLNLLGQYAPPPPPTAARRAAIPTDQDWQQFKKMVKDDLDTGLRLGLAEKTVKTRSCSKGKRPFASGEDDIWSLQHKRICLSRQVTTTTSTTPAITTLSPNEEDKSSSRSSNSSRWTVEGASLVWRYTMPSLPGF